MRLEVEVTSASIEQAALLSDREGPTTATYAATSRANLPKKALLKLRLDYDTLAAIRPDIIPITIPAFAALDRQNDAIRAQLAAEVGLSAHILPPEESARRDAALEPVVTDWAERMDARGKKGSAALAAWRPASDRF